MLILGPCSTRFLKSQALSTSNLVRFGWGDTFPFDWKTDASVYLEICYTIGKIYPSLSLRLSKKYAPGNPYAYLL